MTDAGQIRINELARGFEIKAKVLIDYLPEIGVTEKKTHSSSLDNEHADLVRKHFRSLAEAEAAAESEKEAVTKPKPMPKPAAVSPAPATVAPSAPAATQVSPAAHPKPAVPPAKPAAPPQAQPQLSAPPAASTQPPVTQVPATPTPRPVAPPVATPAPPAPAQAQPVPGAPRPGAAPPPPARQPVQTPVRPAASGLQPTPVAMRPAAAPQPGARPSAPSGQPPARPGMPSQSGPRPITPGQSGPRPATPGQAQQRPSGQGQRPGAPSQPGQRPYQSQGGSGAPNRPPFRQGSGPGGPPRQGAPQGMRPAAAPGSRPSGPPSRFPQRPGGGRPGGPPRPGQQPVGSQRPGATGAGAPKAEPGKPLYARKPPTGRGRPLIEKRFAEGERKLHPVRTRPGVGGGRATIAEPLPAPVQREPREVTVTEGITVRELAEKLDIRAKDLLKTLLDRGVFASINQALDVQTATSLAEAFNGIVQVVTFEEQLVQEEEKREERTGDVVARAPVVTVMGHVDHGKTSLLDSIRQTDVAAGESGGITQHIGAYEVHLDHRRIVFIDTPGHEAFTRMRARGAKVTDIVVLVVAADDGVMPQTEEAIDHARAAKVPIIVAVNKMDKPDAQPERVKRQLADRGLMPEEWGGDTVTVEVSARTKQNIDRLLEMILLVGDLRELKANPDATASGTVLESRVDKGRGPVATMLVQNGTLHVGDVFVVGAVYGKVRAMFDDRGHPVKQVGPATPVEVLGLQGVPEAGDQFSVADEAKARHIVEYRQAKQREAALAKSASGRLTLDQLHEQLKAGEVKELPIVVKADVQGSVEVLSEMIPKLSSDQVKLKIIHASVGAVTETDVLLASASNAVIVAFNVRPERKALDLAQQEGVDIRPHTIIYELMDELKKAMSGLLAPVMKETYLGRAEVRDTFRIKGVGMIAGCSVQDGSIKRDAEVRVLRDNVVIYTGRVSSLRRFKEDVNEVRSGFECGVTVSNFSDVKVGDVLECFVVERVAPAVATA